MSPHHQILPGRAEGAGPAANGAGPHGTGSIPPGCVGIPETVAQAACSTMLGLMSGRVPLKLSRQVHAQGELALRGVVVAAEYGTGQPLALPAASAEALAGILAPARKE